MTTATIVERFDIVKDVVPGLGARTVMLVMNAFGLEGSEKALDDGIGSTRGLHRKRTLK